MATSTAAPDLKATGALLVRPNGYDGEQRGGSDEQPLDTEPVR
jgi:hypothetical protein